MNKKQRQDNISRREVLKGIAGVTVGSLAIGGATVRGQPNTEHNLARWRAEAAGWWAQNKKDRGPVPVLSPYLKCAKENSSRGSLEDQIGRFQNSGEVAFVIRNEGPGISWSCIAELYVYYQDALLPPGMDPPVSDYPWETSFAVMGLQQRKILDVQAGEPKEVVMSYSRKSRPEPGIPVGGSIVLRCYDPIQDPAYPWYVSAGDWFYMDPQTRMPRLQRTEEHRQSSRTLGGLSWGPLQP